MRQVSSVKFDMYRKLVLHWDPVWDGLAYGRWGLTRGQPETVGGSWSCALVLWKKTDG